MISRYIFILVLMALVFGCTNAPEPKDVMLSSIEKSAKLKSLITDLTMNMTVLSQATTSIITTDIVQYKLDKMTRTDIIVKGVPQLEGVEMRVYSIEEGTYLCGKKDEWDCLSFGGDIGLTGEGFGGAQDWEGMSRGIVESDAFEFVGGVERLEISGRPCWLVSARIDYSKASSFLNFSQDVKNVTLSQCLDDETGVALSGRIVTEMTGGPGSEDGGILINQIDMYVNQLNVNATISDSTFELPATPR
ncbi:MAG: hypothetical protein ABIG39_06630 [Candidatus Micrarchaeota archaeon]